MSLGGAWMTRCGQVQIRSTTALVMPAVIPSLVVTWALLVGRRRGASEPSVMVSRGNVAWITPERLAIPGLIARPLASVPALLLVRKACRLKVGRQTPRGILRSARNADAGHPQNPNAPNLGYGPATTTQMPFGTPPRSFAQRWAVNPLTNAGIAMLRSQSPYLATGIGEGLAGAAGAIEHERAEQVLDSKPVLRNEFPTMMYQMPDGRMIDTHIPNPGYDAKSVPGKRLDWEISQGKKAAWKPTDVMDTVSGAIRYYDANTGREGWAEPTVPGTRPPGPTISDAGWQEAAGGGDATTDDTAAARPEACSNRACCSWTDTGTHNTENVCCQSD